MFQFIRPGMQLNESDNYTEVIVSPLERGYGNTLGSILKKTLLTCIPGIAVYGYRITGKSDNDLGMVGVKETVEELILNIKQIRFAKKGKQLPKVIALMPAKTGVMTADIIMNTYNIQVINPNQPIMTVTDDTAAKAYTIELLIGENTGVTDLPKEYEEDGYHLIQSHYSPVIWAESTVTTARVGQVIDFESLKLEVETDGTITAKDAIETAAKIITNTLGPIISMNPDTVAKETVATPPPPVPAKETCPIEELVLPTRAMNALKRAQILTIDDLISKSRKELSAIRGLGTLMVIDIVIELRAHGYYLRGEDPKAD